MDPRSDALVLFGATGDLARRKLFPALYRLARRGRLGVPVVGFASSPWDTERLRAYARESLAEFERNADPAAVEALLASLRYVRAEYRDPATYRLLCDALGGATRPLFYLAIPPSLFAEVVSSLAKSGCARDGRVVVEKPFGRDLASARELNRVLHTVFDEGRIYRIDHFMGKEAVQNLLYFRFANSFVEPLWNRHHVAAIEITMAETLGMEGRGRFYEEVGALRDVVQNHLLQVVALLTMEPPVAPDAESVRDENAKALRAIRPLTGRSLVRGQYAGYREEPGVAESSLVETYAAMQLHIDSWRWAGVPIFVRAGKRLAVTATEVRVELQRPPLGVLHRGDELGRPNYFRFRLGPDVVIALGARAKAPGEEMRGRQVELSVCQHSPDEMTAYERLLGDALEGDAALFGRQDGVEAAWRVVDPVLRKPTRIHPYAPGSWGPEAARAMIAPYGGWDDPVVA